MFKQVRTPTGLLAAFLAGNGMVMLAAPSYWYHATPAVSLTGPINQHFVRDVGCAYLTTGFGLAWGLWRPSLANATATLAAAFLSLHAAIHLFELAAGICGWGIWLQSFPGVSFPAICACILAWQTRLQSRTLAA